MKKYLLPLLLLFCSLTLSAEQAKRVYITLDLSSSMFGDKYSLANYTAQMIVTLCDDDDDVSIIMGGKEINLSSKPDPLESLQHPSSQNPLIPALANRDIEINDIIEFNRIYKPSAKKQDWLFIIGDGAWADSPYDNAVTRFKQIVGQGKLNVCFLQTGSSLQEHSDFSQDLEPLGVVDMGKSDTNPQTIKDGCDHFARKILGFSDVPLKIKKVGDRCISLTAELPLTEFFLVYQDASTPEDLPAIGSVTATGKALNAVLKGTPTTIPTKDKPEVVDLSGHVWSVKAGDTIPAGTEIQVCFDKAINPDNISIYPLVKDIEFGSFGLAPLGGKLKQLDSKTFCIGSSNNTAVVRIELSESSQDNLPEALLKKTIVIVKANNKDYPAHFKNGGFECEIDLEGYETQYYAECDCPGYFKRVTPIAKIVKGDCDPEPAAEPELPEMELPVMEFDPMTIEALRNDPMRFYLHNIGETDALDPTKFDITVEVADSFLYDDPSISFQGDTVALNIRPKGQWCDCFFPDEINFTIVSTPKEGAFEAEGLNYSRMVKPGRVPVIKDEPWLSRCLWVLITMAGLLLFILYLRALLKKNRFHKNARMLNSYYEDGSPKEIQKPGRPLRAPGLAAWLDRWLNPFGDEKNTISFHRPKTKNLTFIASPSKNKVLLKENCFDPKLMIVPNYVPKPKVKKEKTGEPIPFNSGTSIEIKIPQGTTAVRAGHLKYVVKDKDDEAGFNTFIGILMVLSILSLIALAILLIRGL